MKWAPAHKIWVTNQNYGFIIFFTLDLYPHAPLVPVTLASDCRTGECLAAPLSGTSRIYLVLILFGRVPVQEFILVGDVCHLVLEYYVKFALLDEKVILSQGIN